MRKHLFQVLGGFLLGDPGLIHGQPEGIDEPAGVLGGLLLHRDPRSHHCIQVLIHPHVRFFQRVYCEGVIEGGWDVKGEGEGE